jgi:two-component system sensor histidine kinase/response regulator
VLEKPVTPSSLLDCLTQADDAAQAVKAEAKPRAGLERLVGARILVVEDNPVNQQLASELLRRAGMHVVVAEDGQQALDRLRESGPFDGVLMDCQMPVMDGYTATSRLRENPGWRHLPVIAMTANAFPADRERALASGMNAHITKPLDPEVMLRTMAEWIAAKPPAAGGREDRGRADAPIDTAAGLASCDGDATLYRRLLHGFRSTQADLAQRLAAGTAPLNDDELLYRLHDLMGLAATIGAKSLAQAARALHAALTAGERARVDSRRSRLAAELHAALQAIDGLLPADGAR